MVNKEILLKFVDALGDGGRDVFGGRVWAYIKEAVREYDGEPISDMKMAELILKVTTPIGWIEEPQEEPIYYSKRDAGNIHDITYRPRPFDSSRIKS